MYKRDIIFPFITIILTSIIFLTVPEYAWIFLLIILSIFIYLKITNKKEFYIFKFENLDQIIKYIISLILIYFLNIFILSYFFGEKTIWYYLATIMIYIISITLLTTKFGEKLEEKCILCHQFKILNYISLPILLLNFILSCAMYITTFYWIIEKFGIITLFCISILLASTVSLCWHFKNKIHPKLTITWSLFIALSLINYLLFTKGGI